MQGDAIRMATGDDSCRVVGGAEALGRGELPLTETTFKVLRFIKKTRRLRVSAPPATPSGYL